MKLKELLADLDKVKVQPTDLYLLALRQMLLNQSELLGRIHSGNGLHLANDSKRLADRIGEFIENQQ